MVQHRTAPLYTAYPITWQKSVWTNGEASVPKWTNQILSPWNVKVWLEGDCSWDVLHLHFWKKALSYLGMLSSGTFQHPIFSFSIDARNYYSILLSNPIFASWLSWSVSAACHQRHLNWFKCSEYRFYDWSQRYQNVTFFIILYLTSTFNLSLYTHSLILTQHTFPKCSVTYIVKMNMVKSTSHTKTPWGVTLLTV